MNYEDELERSRARRSRARSVNAAPERGGRERAAASHRQGGSAGRASGESRSKSSRSYTPGEENEWSSLAEPGSRADRSRQSAGGRGHGNYRRNRRGGKDWKKVTLAVVIGLVIFLAAVAIGAYVYINGKFKEADKNPFNIEEVENTNISLEMKEKMEEGYWTVAIFGVDSRDSSTGKGNRSDVIMIANLDRKTGEIKLVSVFRDSYLNINDKNTYNKINEAYAQGGPEQAVKALNKNLDLNITHYATFNWKAVATAINILGGVDIEISKSEYYYINSFITETVKATGLGSHQLKGPGLHHMDGVQAVAYGRLRLMDTDYARTERQRIVIAKAFEKAKKANLQTLNDLVGNMFYMCATNINFNDVAALIPNITKYHLGETTGFPMARGEQKIKGADCVIPQTLVSNVTSLHEFLYGEENYTPSSTVQTISKKISEVSGLYKAGKEIGHVPTDKGYIPKATKAPVVTTTEAEETESESETESELEASSEGETDENGDPIDPEESESSTSSTLESPTRPTRPGESETDFWNRWERPTDPSGNVIPPTSGPANEATRPRETNEDGGPKSPADVPRETDPTFGPGHMGNPTEATMSPGSGRPGSGSLTEPTTAASSVIVPPPSTSGIKPPPAASTSPSPTSPAPTLPAPTTAPTVAPSSPADMTLPQGNTGGPSSQATQSAFPGGM